MLRVEKQGRPSKESNTRHDSGKGRGCFAIGNDEPGWRLIWHGLQRPPQHVVTIMSDAKNEA